MTLLLGIESSCDETAAAVVRDGREVKSSRVASQHELHAPWRGVVPELASRAHAERLPAMIEAALAEAGVSPDELDGVAVAARPGLLGALLVGVCGAKAFAWAHGLPLVDVDHVEAHVYSPLLVVKLEPPYVCLVASGGHTALYLARGFGEGEIDLLGTTRDDAAGEAFDKLAAMLELGFPGGPAVQRLASGGDPDAVELPTTRLEGLQFSFSGLKTAARYALEGRGKHAGGPPPAPADLAAAFQRAVAEQLVSRLAAAAEQAGVSRVAIAGGVAANSALRAASEALCATKGWRLAVPPLCYCTDNAAMIAGLGFHRLRAGLTAPLELEPSPRSEARELGRVLRQRAQQRHHRKQP